MLQTAGAAEGGVFLAEGSIQTRLQKLHPAHKRLALLHRRHGQQFGLLGTHTQNQDVLHLPANPTHVNRVMMTMLRKKAGCSSHHFLRLLLRPLLRQISGQLGLQQE